MGANATTSVPAYVAGEVLTAADLTVTNSGIPVFADSTARTNGFDGTGEKALAEGQYAYLESDDKTYVYDGAAWQEVGASGLVPVKAQAIGSAVSSVTVTDAFSSTYDNYKIIVSGGAGSTNLELRLTLGSTAAGYYSSYNGNNWGGSAIEVRGQSNQAYAIVGVATANNIHCSMDVFEPNAAKRTRYFFEIVQSQTGNDINNSGAGGGFLNDATQYTAFTLTTNTGTLTGGTIRVYGYRN